MLGEHAYGVVFSDAVIQVETQASKEVVENGADSAILNCKQGAYAGLMPLRDVADIGGPLLPIPGVRVLVYDLGEDGVAQLGRAYDDKRETALDPFVA